MPHPSESPVAVVDVRDLADFAVRSCEERLSGPYVIAPDPAQCTFGALAKACGRVFGRPTSDVVWVDESALVKAGVEPWAALPFWLPSTSDSRGANAFDASRARAAGFKTRSLADTVASVADWLEYGPEQEDIVPPAILDPELESTLVGQAQAISH
jgi:nucleoside-diphosphate-sugar epimerase